VAIGVVREAIEARIRSDMQLFKYVAESLSKNGFQKYAKPIEAAIKEVERMLKQETDAILEARNTRELKRQSESDPKIEMRYVDAMDFEDIWERTNASETLSKESLRSALKNVIIMDLAEGIPLNDLTEEAAKEFRAVKAREKGLTANLREMFIFGKTDADPQPGNFFIVLENEELIRLDIGQKYILTRQEQETLLRFIAALDAKDAANVAKYWIKVTEGEEADKKRARAEITSFIRRNRHLSGEELFLQVQVISGNNNLYRTKTFFAATKQLAYLFEMNSHIETYNSEPGLRSKLKTMDLMIRDIDKEKYKVIGNRLFARKQWVRVKDAAESTGNFIKEKVFRRTPAQSQESTIVTSEAIRPERDESRLEQKGTSERQTPDTRGRRSQRRTSNPNGGSGLIGIPLMGGESFASPSRSSRMEGDDPPSEKPYRSENPPENPEPAKKAESQTENAKSGGWLYNIWSGVQERTSNAIDTARSFFGGENSGKDLRAVEDITDLMSLERGIEMIKKKLIETNGSGDLTEEIHNARTVRDLNRILPDLTAYEVMWVSLLKEVPVLHKHIHLRDSLID